MSYKTTHPITDLYLEHHGIKGQKWGVRRFQNKDGSVTTAGAKRYYDNIEKYSKAYNSASSYSDRADSEFKKAKKMRKKLKLRDVVQNKSKEAKEYSKQYDKAMKMQETADIKWKEAKELYKATGKNAVSRVLNNMKYDLDKKK